MKAIEFETTVHNGVLTVPPEHQDWNDKPVRVILQERPEKPAEPGQRPRRFSAVALDTRGFRFDRDEANER